MKQPKRISVEVTDEFMVELKLAALLRNVSIRKFVIAAVKAQLDRDKKYQ